MGGKNVWLGLTFFAYFNIALKIILSKLWVLGLLSGFFLDLYLEAEGVSIFNYGFWRGSSWGSRIVLRQEQPFWLLASRVLILFGC